MNEVFLFNTLNRKKEPFKPIEAKKAGIYTCGPTVYWFAHIGNMRAYIFADILRRTLELNGYSVKHIMNITDVGHLTDDASEGEDKMLVAMKREGKSAGDIAKFYTDAFLSDIKELNILKASKYPRATEHIKDQIKMIVQLEKNGFTYRTSDGIYFDTSKLADYGKLSGQRSEEKLGGARVALGEKKNSTDFALWKLSALKGG
ncbi:TPA: cysteine--tRNA ligase, partial [Candidatus Uhrbacteria bacterium]|nr:cysteine--tRNA ligase [Candidatus Uhrbacteria bacterium]